MSLFAISESPSAGFFSLGCVCLDPYHGEIFMFPRMSGKGHLNS